MRYNRIKRRKKDFKKGVNMKEYIHIHAKKKR